MKFTKIEKIPREGRYHKLQYDLRDFMSLNVKLAKVELAKGEYASASSAASSIHKGAKHGGFPIEVSMHNGEVYLKRMDM